MTKSLFKVGQSTAPSFEVLDTAGVASLLLNGSAVAVGAQQATIADAVTTHALNATFSDTEVEAALNALGVKINAILAALEANTVLAAA